MGWSLAFIVGKFGHRSWISPQGRGQLLHPRGLSLAALRHVYPEVNPIVGLAPRKGWVGLQPFSCELASLPLLEDGGTCLSNCGSKFFSRCILLVL